MRNRPGGRRPRRRHDRRRRSCRQGGSTGRVRRGGADARGGLAVGGDGSIHVAGAIQASERKVIVDALLVKFASDGSLAWDRVWGGRSGDVSSGVAVAADGNGAVVRRQQQLRRRQRRRVPAPHERRRQGDRQQHLGGPGIDHGDGVAVGPTGTISLVVTAETAPVSFLGAPAKTSRARGIVTITTTPLADAVRRGQRPGRHPERSGWHEPRPRIIRRCAREDRAVARSEPLQDEGTTESAARMAPTVMFRTRVRP